MTQAMTQAVSALRTINLQLLVSHVLAGAFGVVFLMIALTLIGRNRLSQSASELNYFSDPPFIDEQVVRFWISGEPDGKPNGSGFVFVPGASVIAAPDGTVRYGQGDTICRAGMRLADCAPELVDLPTEERLVEGWREQALRLSTGDTIYTRREAVPGSETFVVFSDTLATRGFVELAVLAGAVAIVIALPLAVLVIWRTILPQTRRLARIERASRALVSGELLARVRDWGGDDIGELARDFDDMADALTQMVGQFEMVNQQNLALIRQMEQNSVQAERLRLARDLHDSLSQRLFSLASGASSLPQAVRVNPQHARQTAAFLVELAETALDELQTVLVDVRPPSIIVHGLEGALAALCDQWSADTHIPLNRTLLTSGRPISPEVEDLVYRVAQESLNNVARHAEAQLVEVLMVQGQRRLSLSIADDGRGFDQSQERPGRYGLAGMLERARAVSGDLAIESHVGRGTTVELNVSTGIASKTLQETSTETKS